MVQVIPGVYVAVVTPMDENGEVAEEVFERLCVHLIEQGVTGLAILGSTGEGVSLSDGSRRTVQRITRGVAENHVRIITCVGSASVGTVLRQIDEAAQYGADAVLVPPPFYYPLTDRELVQFYGTVAGRASLPLLIYNIPALTKISVSPVSTTELAQHPSVIGMKDSSRNMEYFMQVATTAETDFLLFTGSDDLLLPSLTCGGAGAICASANVAPQFAQRLVSAYAQGDLEVARRWQSSIVRLVRAARAQGTPKAWKAMLELQGFAPMDMAPPFLPLDAKGRAQLQGILEELNVL